MYSKIVKLASAIALLGGSLFFGSAGTSQGADSYVKDNLYAGKLAVGTTSSPWTALDLISDVPPATCPWGARVNHYSASAPDSTWGGMSIRTGSSNGAGTNYYVVFVDAGGTTRGGVGLLDQQPSIVQWSDLAAKTDIELSSLNASSTIMKLRVKDFRYLDGDKRLTGFIAQEVEAAYPDAVADMPAYGDEGKPAGGKGIAPLQFIPVLWKCAQEQIELNAELEKKVKDLEAKLESLQTGNAAAQTALLIQEGGESVSAQQLRKKIADQGTQEMGIKPWVEITLAEAWEEAAETLDTPVTKAATRYEINWQTMRVDAKQVQETVTEKKPTGKTVRQLRPGVEFDTQTGKFFRRVSLQEVALRKGAPAVAQALEGALLSATQTRLSAAAK